MNRRHWLPLAQLALVVAGAGALTPAARAQERPEDANAPLPPGALRIEVTDFRAAAERIDFVDNGLPNVLLTGYWPPSNEALRPFSPDPNHNPGPWVGENWESRGYNLYAFFPEFPDGLGQGEGDFEVDYQDTSGDFWRLVEALKPIAIIAYGRSGYDDDWEIEGGNRMYTLSSWSNDYEYPFDPTPELPIANETPGNEYYSTLPAQAIIDAVEAAVPQLYPYSTAIDTSRYLCNFMGYHANWWYEDHHTPGDPAWIVSAGFIHLGYRMTWEEAVIGAEATARAVLTHVDAIVPRGDLDTNGLVNSADVELLLGCLGGPGVTTAPSGPRYGDFMQADLSGDGDVDLGDVAAVQALPLDA